MKKVACLLGSFNPIHNGHLHLGEKILKETNVDEVWYITSPKNPFKKDNDLEDENHRLEMVNLSMNNNKFISCDIEFSMDRPSYTYKTLRELSSRYPSNEFYLVIGSDVINSMYKWKNVDEVSKYPIITFIRDDEEINLSKCITEDIQILKSDSNLSSTEIRNRIKNKQPLDEMVYKVVEDYININNLYGSK